MPNLPQRWAHIKGMRFVLSAGQMVGQIAESLQLYNNNQLLM